MNDSDVIVGVRISASGQDVTNDDNDDSNNIDVDDDGDDNKAMAVATIANSISMAASAEALTTATTNTTTMVADSENLNRMVPTKGTTITSTSVSLKQMMNLCTRCGSKRRARGCTQNCCAACCRPITTTRTTVAPCPMHQRIRDQAVWKEQVLSRTTPIQLLAQQKRQQLLSVGRFRESAFRYLGDTVVLWDIREYARHAKWRDDAIRRSLRRYGNGNSSHRNSYGGDMKSAAAASDRMSSLCSVEGDSAQQQKPPPPPSNSNMPPGQEQQQQEQQACKVEWRGERRRRSFHHWIEERYRRLTMQSSCES